jgi:DNA-binding GntR family transcriptional regulator
VFPAESIYNRLCCSISSARTGIQLSPTAVTKRPAGKKRKANSGPVRHSIFELAAPDRKPGEVLGDYAYRVLREAIRAGVFESGDHLREADVASWLDISRTPVREAFHRIVSEGLLVIGSWNGAMVAQLDAQQLVDLYAVRALLEGAAASLAAEHASRVEIKNLFAIADKEKAAKNDPAALVIINAELHQAIYSAAHNRYLLQSLNTIVDTLGLLRHSTFVLPGSIELAHKEHLGILRAIRDGDSKKAEELASAHINNALELRLQLLQEKRK